MVIYARAKDLPISPQKMGLVLDLIRGKPVSEVRRILEFSPKKGAKFVLETLNSAVANAKNKGEGAPRNLKVVEARADKARVLKRWQPRARGRVDRILKRRTHLIIGLNKD